MRNPYEPVPIIEPREVTRIIRRVVGYFVVCLGCGQTFRAVRRQRRTCSERCRQRMHKLKVRQAQYQVDQQQAQAVELRRNGSRRPGAGLSYPVTTQTKADQSSLSLGQAHALPLDLDKANARPGSSQASSALPLPTSSRTGVS